jgi:hypothetical protein
MGIDTTSSSRPFLMNTTRSALALHSGHMKLWRSKPGAESCATLVRINSSSHALQRMPLLRPQSATHRSSSTPVCVDSLLVRQSTRSGPLRFPALTRRFVPLSFFPSACGAKLLLGADRLGSCRVRHLRRDSPLCFRSLFGTFRFLLRHLDNLRRWICPSRQHPIHPIRA